MHGVVLTDDNVDAPPVCAFSNIGELAIAPNPASSVECTAQYTVTLEDIEAGGTLDNTARLISDKAEAVYASYSIPFGIFADSFESQ